MKTQNILCLCTAGRDRSVAIRDFLIRSYPERTKWNTWAAGIRQWANPDNTTIEKLLQADLIFAADTQHETFARGAIRGACHALGRTRPDVQIVNLHLRDYEKEGEIPLPLASILRVMESRCNEKPEPGILRIDRMESGEFLESPEYEVSKGTGGKPGKAKKSRKAKK